MSQHSRFFPSLAWQAPGLVGAAKNQPSIFAAGLAAYKKEYYATAIRIWKPLADLGNIDAQYNLGAMYGNGLGVRQDHEEAARLFHLAADQGDASAQFNLGVRYDNGLGVPQDDKAAASLFRLAAAQGDARALSKISERTATDPDRAQIS